MKKNNLGKKLVVFFSLLLMVAGSIALILIQKPLSESQELRQQASVDEGQVIVSSSNKGAGFLLGEEAHIKLTFNTHSLNTHGVSLLFNMVTSTFADPPEVTVFANAGLKSFRQDIQKVSDGFLVSVMATPPAYKDPYKLGV